MSGGGAPKRTFGNQTPPVDNTVTPGKGFSDNRSTAEIKVNRSLKPTTKENATLEAEKGETVVTSLNKDGLPEFYNIGGKRHSRGGTPLNLPEDSFIYSRTNEMKIYNKEILNYFGKTAKGQKGFTPAEVSRNFNLNKYRQILADPNSDRMQIETAEMMMQNYSRKLGALALVQESAKGFDSGIPGIAMPYIEMMGIDPTEFVGSDENGQAGQEAVQAMYGGQKYFKGGKTWADVQIDNKQDKGWGSWLSTENKMGVDNLDAGITMLSNIGDRRTAKKSGSLEGTVEDLMQEGVFTNADRVANAYEPGSSNAGTYAQNATDVFRPNEMGYPTQFTGLNYGQIGGPAVTKYGGTPKTLQRFDKGGQATLKDTKLRKGDSVKFDPYSQRYIILSKNGKVRGYLNAPVTEGAGGPNDLNTQTKSVESSKPTKSQNIPSDAKRHYPNKEGYDESTVEAGDYIMKGNRWYKVTGKKVSPYSGTSVDKLNQSLSGEHGDLREAYGRLESKINGSPKLQEELVKRYRISVAEAKAKGILKQSDIDEAAALGDAEIIANYLSSQEQIMIINANKGNIGAGDKQDTWDKGVDSATGLPKSYVAAANELNLTPKSIGETFAFQSVYNSMQGLYDDPEWKDELADYSMPKQGLNDESTDIYSKGTISPADGWWGNTTVGQAQVYKPVQKELDMEEVADTDIPVDPAIEHLPGQMPGDPYTPYWKQDLRNIGAAGYGLASVRKGDPILQKPMYNELNPTFADFRSGANRQGALGNAGLEASQRFGASAAQTQAAFGQIQKNNAAGVIALQDQEYKTNLGIANETTVRHEAGRNQASQYNSALTKNYWDETERANQMFKDEKMANFSNLIASINQADTNRGMTQSMNIMRDDWWVDPRTGFTRRKFNPTQITPKSSQSTSMYDVAEGYKHDNPGMTWAEATALAKADQPGANAIPNVPEGYVNPAAYGYPGAT